MQQASCYLFTVSNSGLRLAKVGSSLFVTIEKVSRPSAVAGQLMRSVIILQGRHDIIRLDTPLTTVFSIYDI